MPKIIRDGPPVPLMNSMIVQLSAGQPEFVDVILLITDEEKRIFQVRSQHSHMIDKCFIPAPHLAAALDDDMVALLRSKDHIWAIQVREVDRFARRSEKSVEGTSVTSLVK